MPKFPILLIAGGLLIAIVGCVLTSVFYAIQVSQSFNSTMDLAGNSDAEAAKLCNENEKLVTEKGSSHYDMQSHSYVRDTTYYCENSEGQRRDVTQEFAAKVVGKVGDVFSSVFSFRWEFVCASGVGLLMIGAGIVLLIMRGRSTPPPAPPAPTSGMGGTFTPLQ